MNNEMTLFTDFDTLNMIRAIRMKNSGKTWPQVWQSIPNGYDKVDTFKRTVKRWHDDNQETLGKIGLTLNEGRPGRIKQ